MKRRKIGRILYAYLLILALSGTSVYADESEVPDAVQEEIAETEDTSEDKTEVVAEDTSESAEDATEVSSDSTETSTGTSMEGISSYIYAQDAGRVAELRRKYAEDILATQKVREILNNMKLDQNSFIENLQKMDEEIISLQTRMDEMEEDRKSAEAMLAKMEYELELARQDVEAQYQKLKDHIRNSYENGTYTYLDAFLSSTKFSDVLNQTEYVQQVSLYDSLLLIRYQAARQMLANKTAMLKSMTDDYGVMQTYYQDQQEALVLVSNEKEQQILAFQTRIDEQEKELLRLKVQEQQDANEILRIEAELRTMQSQLNAETPVNLSRDPIVFDYVPYEGGVFVWPLPSSTDVSSRYGWRGDIGIAGATKDHKGVDIEARMGAPLVAAASGTVTYVGYGPATGNIVKIDIGQGMTIIYQHMSAFAVVKGDTVAAGQLVGYVGSTGISGGPHLHFGLTINGEFVNPEPYLGL